MAYRQQVARLKQLELLQGVERRLLAGLLEDLALHSPTRASKVQEWVIALSSVSRALTSWNAGPAPKTPAERRLRRQLERDLLDLVTKFRDVLRRPAPRGHPKDQEGVVKLFLDVTRTTNTILELQRRPGAGATNKEWLERLGLSDFRGKHDTVFGLIRFARRWRADRAARRIVAARPDRPTRARNYREFRTVG
jgi:hypothetical protein